MKIILYMSLYSLIFLACTPSQNTDIFKNEVIIDYMQRVCDYQLTNPTPHHSKNRNFPNGWVPASFYTGVLATYKITGNKKYLNAAISWSEKTTGNRHRAYVMPMTWLAGRRISNYIYTRMIPG